MNAPPPFSPPWLDRPWARPLLSLRGRLLGLPRTAPGAAAGMAAPAQVLAAAARAKGFLAPAEGERLFTLAAESSRRAPCLEVGSYCGKSTLLLAAGCRAASGHPLFAVDHHRGSEEQQPGQPWFDPELLDPETGRPDSLPHLRRNLAREGLEPWVIPVVASSARLGRYWAGLPLALVFVDGAHGDADVWSDFQTWGPKVVRGGYLCFHDVFADPAAGGQAPYRVFEHARARRAWQWVDQVGSLGVLRRR